MPDPSWLSEAYAEPINRSDTGYVWRNLWCRDKVCSIIEAGEINPDGRFLDYAAGFGLFVRLMRDAGYDFRWSDLYCQNLFSRGFEAASPLSEQFEAITAFEVLEHLPNPREEIEIITALTPTFIFSTTLLPEPAPLPENWWYYGLEHGQHISFFTKKSLEILASQIGYELSTNGSDFHVLSQKGIQVEIPALKKARYLRFWSKPQPVQKPTRPSLVQSDHDQIVKLLRNRPTI